MLSLERIYLWFHAIATVKNKKDKIGNRLEQMLQKGLMNYPQCPFVRTFPID